MIVLVPHDKLRSYRGIVN